MHRSRQRWLVGVGLLIVLAALRLPWLEADAGNWSFWSYAAFGPDETQYTDGGRLAVLTGKFLDPEMSEPVTFLGSWGMHFLSYLGYRLTGMTRAASRWPTVLLAIVGWLAAYIVVSRRTAPLVAGTVVLLLSCNPFSLTFERIASNDVTVGALAIIVYALITCRRLSLAVLGGGIIALAVSVKATALLLCPLIMLATIAAGKSAGRRLTIVGVSFMLTFGALWLGRQVCIRNALGPGDHTAQLREVSRGYTTLNGFDWDVTKWGNPISIFPRWPIAHHYGPLIVWLILLPILCLGSAILRREYWLSSPMVVSIGILIYLSPFATQSIHVARYFIPAIFFLPILLTRARDKKLANPTWGKQEWILLGFGTLCLGALYWVHSNLPPRADLMRSYLYNEFVLPREAAWTLMSWRLPASWLASTIVIAGVLPQRNVKQWAVAAGLGFAWTWLFFNSYTISLMTTAWEFVVSQLLLQLALAVMLATSLGAFGRGWQRWYLTLALMFCVFTAANPYWRIAFRDLWTRTFYVRNATHEIESHLTSDSIVIGRRAPLFLRQTRLRVGMQNFAYSPTEFLQKVTHLLERYPNQPLFWLVDGDGCFTWDYYREAHEKPWQVTPVARVLVPSGDTLQLKTTTEDRLPLISVYLFRVTKQ